MTARDGFSPLLETWLAEEGVELTPDYLGAVLDRTTGTRQRPAWASLERWLPVTTTLDRARAVSIPRPARYLVLAALVLLVALAALVIYAGSRQPRIPAPFGPAANGRIAVASGGDIHLLDPVSGATATLVAGPDEDVEPEFSPSGTKIAFRRTVPGSGESIVVVRTDGSDAMTITSTPTAGGFQRLEWSPDDRYIVATTKSEPKQVLLFDATRPSASRRLASDAEAYQSPFRPPAGSEVLVRVATPDGDATIVAVNVATGWQRTVLNAIGGATGEARWSPDGSKIVYDANPDEQPDSHELFVADADGSDAHRVTTAPGTWYDVGETWSPDGAQIAFARWDAVKDFEVLPISILTLADGTIRNVGPVAAAVRRQAPTPGGSIAAPNESYYFEWSPDGRSIIAVPTDAASHVVLIDVAAGTYRILDPVVDAARVHEIWQRLAP